MASKKSPLSKSAIQNLVILNSPLISFAKPTNVRSEFWTNYSQIYYQDIVQDYILCSNCKTVLKWRSESGTRVMSHHHCVRVKPVTSTTPRQRTISSYCQQSSSSIECPLIQKRITEACVEYCAVDGRSFESVAGAGFANLAKQLINAGATLGSSVSASDLLPHPSTVSAEFTFQF